MIKKIAGPPPGLPREEKVKITPVTPPNADIPARPRSPKLPGPGAQQPKAPSGYIASSKPIQSMQIAMQDLARAVMQDAHSSSIYRKQNDVKTTPADPRVDSFKSSFNNFIAEQYVGPLDPAEKGTEWSVRPNVTSFPKKKEGETDIYELDVVMNSLKRIGSPNSELNKDGNWEFRTNNALKNIMGFAYAMLQVEGDFGFINKSFTKQNLDEFKGIMSDITVNDNGNLVYNGSEKPVPLNVRNEKATKLTYIINGIKKMYQDFRMHIFGNPEYRNLIEGQDAFQAYGPQGTNPGRLSIQETSALDNELKSARLYGVKYYYDGNNLMNNIPLSALRSKDAYLAYMKHYNKNEKQAIDLFDELKYQIEQL